MLSQRQTTKTWTDKSVSMMLSSSLGACLATKQAIGGICISGLHQIIAHYRAAHTAGSWSSGRKLNKGPTSVLRGEPAVRAVDSSIKYDGSSENFKGVLQQQLDQMASFDMRLASVSQQSAQPPESPGQPVCDSTVEYMPNQGGLAQVRMESQLIFQSCWRRFKQRHGMDFAAPREVIWLNGAPGSGKGVSTQHILQTRGMTRSVCMSDLLSTAAEAQKFIEAGEMIADNVVGDLLLDALLLPVSAGVSTTDLNAVVDGFPRTAVQVDFLKLLMEKLRHLHTKYMDTPFAARFPRPAFKVVMLYVDEETSVNRQMQRAALAQAHNRRAKDAGVIEQQLQQERSTDVEPEKARKRYFIFKQHYSAVLRLKQFFPFHLIDASYRVSDTQEQITQELRYQSSLDLSEETYSAIRHLPLAKDLQQTARQQLVSRLEDYCSHQRPLFASVLGLVQQEVVPLLQQGALSGAAEWVSQSDLFTNHPACVDMMLDVLSDRGFHAHYVREVMAVPEKFDAVTGSITSKLQPMHRFRFTFDSAGVRDASALKTLEIAARITEAARTNTAGQGEERGNKPFSAPSPITESFIPEHLDIEAKMRAQEKAQQVKRVSLAGRQASDSHCDRCKDTATCKGQHNSKSVPGDVFVIHRCLRPESNCGHAEELEVVSASG